MRREDAWFRRAGWIHIPASWPGALATILALAFCAQTTVAVDRRSHSASDTLYNAFPFIACTFLLWDWLASRTSGMSPESPPASKES